MYCRHLWFWSRRFIEGLGEESNAFSECGLSLPRNSCFLCVGETIETALGFQEEENDCRGGEDVFLRDAEQQPLARDKGISLQTCLFYGLTKPPPQGSERRAARMPSARPSSIRFPRASFNVYVLKHIQFNKSLLSTMCQMQHFLSPIGKSS